MAVTQKKRTQIKAIVAAFVVALTLIVVLQNTGAVNTKVLFGAFTLPLALLLGLTFGSGMLAGAVLLRRWAHRGLEE